MQASALINLLPIYFAKKRPQYLFHSGWVSPKIGLDKAINIKILVLAANHTPSISTYS